MTAHNQEVVDQVGQKSMQGDVDRRDTVKKKMAENLIKHAQK